jgi:hypothetical protein
VLALSLTLALAACAPKTNAPAAVALDCAQGFEALKAKIASQPGLDAAPKEPSEPYRAYSTSDGQASYFVTEPGAPAHPAIMMQQVTPSGVKTTGCGFGDKAAYDQLAAYIQSLSAAKK